MEWYKNIWNPKKVVVIHVLFEQGTKVFCASKVSIKDASSIDVQHFDSLEAIVQHFGKSVAYHLHLSGNGVLSRKIESSTTYRDELIINGNPDDFLFSSYDDAQHRAVSFCRKSLYEAEQTAFQENKWHLLGVSCGTTVLFTLSENATFELQFRHVIKNGQLTDFKRSETPNKVTNWEGTLWTELELLSQAIVQHYKLRGDSYSSDTEEAEASSENYRQFSQFKWYGVSIIGAILLSLIINYFYQNHLNQRIAELELDLSIHNQNLSMLDLLKQEKTRKEQLVLSAGVNANNFLSFYLDQLGKSVPGAITLNEMTVFPVKGKLKNKRKVEVDQQVIQIMGMTRGNEVLDDWMEQMNRFEWVKSVELINYLKQSDRQAEFELVITLE